MKYLILLTAFVLTSCTTPRIFSKTKPKTQSSSKTSPEPESKGNTKRDSRNSSTAVAFDVLSEARTYLGTPYKYGGNDASGLDCSGLVVLSYNKANVQLPRVSREQAKEGFRIDLGQVAKGDLLFFNTSGKGISHVGIVENIEGNEIYFIHASVSRGVMISKLSNSYWNPRFVEARRVL